MQQDDADNGPGSRRVKQALIAGAAALTSLVLARRARQIRRVAAGLRVSALWLSLPTTSPVLLPAIRAGARRASRVDLPHGMVMAERHIPGLPDTPDVRLIILQRAKRAAGGPVLLWLHGGGYLLGVPEMDARLYGRMLRQIDLTIVGVDYRLAPEHPFPAALDDCMAALDWIAGHAAELGIDPARIAIGGNSAGAGLAAALAQRATDAGAVTPAFQLLVYPMIDDRTAVAADHGGRGELIWTPASNRRAWHAYLGREPGGREERAYAAPARRADLAGLPPAWIGVGSLDLFHAEDIAYARRLQAAGVACELDIVDGAYHGFDIVAADAPASRAFHRGMIDALARALLVDARLPQPS